MELELPLPAEKLRIGGSYSELGSPHSPEACPSVTPLAAGTPPIQ